MRAAETYRAQRRNMNLDSRVPGRRLKHFTRLNGDNRRGEFDASIIKSRPIEARGKAYPYRSKKRGA